MGVGKTWTADNGYKGCLYSFCMAVCLTGPRHGYLCSHNTSVSSMFLSPQTRPHEDLPDLFPTRAAPAYLAILGSFLSLVCRPSTDFWQAYQSQQIFWTVPEEIKEYNRALALPICHASVFCSSYLCGVRALSFSSWKDVIQIRLCYGTTASMQGHVPAIFNVDLVFGGLLQSEEQVTNSATHRCDPC